MIKMSIPSDQLFPGFKVAPNDPSREVKRTPLTITPLPDYDEGSDDDEFEHDQWGEPLCEFCEGWGYTDCFCGGDLCVCLEGPEIPCPRCG